MKEHTLKEEWRPVVGWEDLYDVSSWARVRSLDRIVRYSNGVTHTHRGRVLAPYVDTDGYALVCLSRDDRAPTRRVHHIVARAYLGKRSSEHEVCHNDGDPSNNTPWNLRYDTRKGNASDMAKHGTLRIGNRHPAACVSDSGCRLTCTLLRSGMKHADIATRVGCSKNIVSDISRGRTWVHISGGAINSGKIRHGALR